MTIHEDLPARVRAERGRRGWTQQHLADRAGVALRTVQNFESGTGTPRAKNLRALAAAVGIDPDEDGDDTAVPQRLDICPTCGRPEWPADVDTFLDMLGAYLMATYPDEMERRVARDEITRQIFRPHHG